MSGMMWKADGYGRWKKCTMSDGTTFFEDEETGETTWDCPDDYDSDADRNNEKFAEFEEFTMDDGDLLFELQTLGFFTRVRKPDIASDFFCQDAATKLAFINEKLETGVGSDEDWMQAMTVNDFALVEYLSLFLGIGVKVSLCRTAAQCLAYVGNLYPRLWSDYVVTDKRLDFMLGAAMYLTLRLGALSQVKDEQQLSTVPYMGFDERDVADFHLGDEYNEFAVNASADAGVAADAAADRNMTVMTYLLLIFQFFCREVTIMKYSVDVSLVKVEEVAEVCALGIEGAAKEMRTILKSKTRHEKTSRIEKLLTLVLISVNTFFSEDAYLLTFKVIAALNRQAPVVSSINSTEVASMCTSLQVQGAGSLNISQGVMNLVNDIGCPDHMVPEAVPVLILCTNLITIENSGGFFYSNDVQVIMDVSLRELNNVPFDCDDETEVLFNEELRVKYMDIIESLNAKDLRSDYKTSELRDVLEFVVSSGEQTQNHSPEQFCWSRDTAREMLDNMS
jgi:hypothetical protein